MLIALSATGWYSDPSPWEKPRWGLDRREVQALVSGTRVPATTVLQGVFGQQLGLEADATLSGMPVIARYYFTAGGGLAVIKLVPGDGSQCEAFRRAAIRSFGMDFRAETQPAEVPSDMGAIRRIWTSDRRIVRHVDISGVPWLKERCNLTIHAPDLDPLGS